jgi:hypothetical protein
MKISLLFFFLLPGLLAVNTQSANAQAPKPKSSPTRTPAATDYFPPGGQWDHRTPAAMGLDSEAVDEVIRYGREMEAKAPRDQELAQAESFGREPFDAGVGPFKERGRTYRYHHLQRIYRCRMGQTRLGRPAVR